MNNKYEANRESDHHEARRNARLLADIRRLEEGSRREFFHKIVVAAFAITIGCAVAALAFLYFYGL